MTSKTPSLSPARNFFGWKIVFFHLLLGSLLAMAFMAVSIVAARRDPDSGLWIWYKFLGGGELFLGLPQRLQHWIPFTARDGILLAGAPVLIALQTTALLLGLRLGWQRLSKFKFALAAGLVIAVGAAILRTDHLVSVPTHAILLFRDRDGLYAHDPATHREQRLFDASASPDFSHPRQPYNDTVNFGFAGPHPQWTPGAPTGQFAEEFYSLLVGTGQVWRSRKDVYTVRTDTASWVHIQATRYAPNGQPLPSLDTTVPYQSKIDDDNDLVYDRFWPPRPDPTTTLPLFVDHGRLLALDHGDTTVLIEYDGPLDPKMRSGCSLRALDPMGKFALVEFSPWLLLGTEKLILVELPSLHLRTLARRVFHHLAISPDGRFILASNPQTFINQAWTSEVELFETATGNHRSIGLASFTQWAP